MSGAAFTRTPPGAPPPSPTLMRSSQSVTRAMLRTSVCCGPTTPATAPDPSLPKTTAHRGIPDYHNGHGAWQGQFRVGHFDLVAARYALEVAGPTDRLAITCLDRVNEVLHAESGLICTSYRHEGRQIERLVPGPLQNLEYQEGLTKMLLSSTPGYRALSAAPAGVPELPGRPPPAADRRHVGWPWSTGQDLLRADRALNYRN